MVNTTPSDVGSNQSSSAEMLLQFRDRNGSRDVGFCQTEPVLQKIDELDNVLAQLPPGHDDFRRLILKRKKEFEGR